MLGWTAVAFIAAVIILCGTIHIFASSTASRPYNKYYTSVRVEEGTLSGALPIDILLIVK